MIQSYSICSPSLLFSRVPLFYFASLISVDQTNVFCDFQRKKKIKLTTNNPFLAHTRNFLSFIHNWNLDWNTTHFDKRNFKFKFSIHNFHLGNNCIQKTPQNQLYLIIPLILKFYVDWMKKNYDMKIRIAKKKHNERMSLVDICYWFILRNKAKSILFSSISFI